MGLLFFSTTNNDPDYIALNIIYILFLKINSIKIYPYSKEKNLKIKSI